LPAEIFVETKQAARSNPRRFSISAAAFCERRNLPTAKIAGRRPTLRGAGFHRLKEIFP